MPPNDALYNDAEKCTPTFKFVVTVLLPYFRVNVQNKNINYTGYEPKRKQCVHKFVQLSSVIVWYHVNKWQGYSVNFLTLLVWNLKVSARLISANSKLVQFDAFKLLLQRRSHDREQKDTQKDSLKTRYSKEQKNTEEKKTLLVRLYVLVAKSCVLSMQLNRLLKCAICVRTKRKTMHIFRIIFFTLKGYYRKRFRFVLFDFHTC